MAPVLEIQEEKAPESQAKQGGMPVRMPQQKAQSQETVSAGTFVEHPMCSRAHTSEHEIHTGAKHGHMKTAAMSNPSTPAKNCSNQTHLEAAGRGLSMCTECRRPLFHRPKEKCAKHTVWLCPECLSEEDLQELRGFKLHEEDEQDDEREED